MNHREAQLRTLRQFVDRNAKIARAFKREYEAMTWQAVEEAVRRDPDGVAEYLGLALIAISRLLEEVGPK